MLGWVSLFLYTTKSTEFEMEDKLSEEEQLRIEKMLRRIQKAQERAREQLKSRTSLVNEFLAERRKAAERE